MFLSVPAGLTKTPKPAESPDFAIKGPDGLGMLKHARSVVGVIFRRFSVSEPVLELETSLSVINCTFFVANGQLRLRLNHARPFALGLSVPIMAALS